MKTDIVPYNRLEKEIYDSMMAIYVFDGMKVYQYHHEFEGESLINESRSRSWLLENPIFNMRGWAPGWRDPETFDEILQTRADGSTPVYLPKNRSDLENSIVKAFSLTHNLKLAEFNLKIIPLPVEQNLPNFS